ncbi:hypothetical protein D3C80_1610020 [compost metagenome]
MTLQPQGIGEHLQVNRIIINNQNCAAFRVLQQLRFIRPQLGGCGGFPAGNLQIILIEKHCPLLHHRQGEAEYSPLAKGRLSFNHPAVKLYKLLGNAEAQPVLTVQLLG